MNDPNTPPPLGGHSEAKPPVIHTDPELAVRDLGKPPINYQPHGGPAAAADEAERQAAFDSAFAWHGKELQPFSSSRSGAFAALRFAMGAAALADAMDDMDAFEADACRILWFCSHPVKEWSVLRASPAALQSVIDTWTDEHIPPSELLLASRTALDIYFASRRNEHEFVPTTGKGHGDDLGN